MGLCHLQGFTLPTALLAWDKLYSFAIAGIGPFNERRPFDKIVIVCVTHAFRCLTFTTIEEP